MGKGFETSIKPEEYFILNNGRVLKNLYELMNALESMDDNTFRFHVNENKNDFGNWVRDIFKDDELAELIFESKTREEIIKNIESRLFESEKKDYMEIEAKWKKAKLKHGKGHNAKKLVRAYPFIRSTSKKISQKAASFDNTKPLLQRDIPLDKIEEILIKEKEIEKREEKIEEIEAKIEKELADLAAKKEPKFFSKEFIQGLLIGLLSASILGLIYIKFFV